MNLLLQFAYLQVLDVLTTLAFLSSGVDEANPLVRLLLSSAPSPLSALVALKLFALGLALYCWRTGRQRLLSRVNVYYALLIVWNVIAILDGARLAA